MRIEPPKGINEGLVGLFSHSLFFFLSFLFLLAETFGEITCQKFSFYLILEVDKFVRNKTLSEMCEMSSLKHQKKKRKKTLGSRQRLIQGRPPSSKLRGAGATTICACFADSLEPFGGWWGGPSAIKGVLPEGLAVCFCGRHAGDQGSERTDWAGLEPPLSLRGLFSLITVQPSKVMVNSTCMPLVSLSSLCLHLCLSHSASLSFLSLSSTPPLISSSCSFILPPRLLLFPLMDFCCKIQTTACMHLFFLFILHHKVNAYSPAEVLIV